MPELPEVETIRRDLDHQLRGAVVEAVTATGTRTLRRHPDPQALGPLLAGSRLAEVGRRGKYLLLALRTPEAPEAPSGPGEGDSAHRVLVVHLGMSGQLLLAPRAAAAVKHTHVVLHLSGERDLRFVDPRTFGEVFLTSDAGAALGHLGIEPLDIVRWQDLGAVLRSRTTKLKVVLMDQRVVAGIGNIYSDEILFAARLRFDRPASSLTGAEMRRLHQATTSILRRAIGERGSSLADLQYRDVFGVLGGYQLHHQVYGREGEPCSRCGRLVQRARIAGRSTFFCPHCQR